MGKGLTRQVLEAVRRCPTWVTRLARELKQRTWETKTILSRLEKRGFIYSRLYTWHGPRGEPHRLRAYFPAGKADGMSLPGAALGPDLPTREALRALQPVHQLQVDILRKLDEEVRVKPRRRSRPLSSTPTLEPAEDPSPRKRLI